MEFALRRMIFNIRRGRTYISTLHSLLSTLK